MQRVAEKKPYKKLNKCELCLGKPHFSVVSEEGKAVDPLKIGAIDSEKWSQKTVIPLA